jgi:L-fucose mutarotase
MLKGIDKVISPELLKILASMGHGDTIVLGDRNFPAVTWGKQCVRADGVDGITMLEAILKLMPIDDDGDGEQIMLMGSGDLSDPDPVIWAQFESVVKKYEPNAKFKKVERHKFYEYSHESFATVQTTDNRPYACIILRKGYILD